MICCGISVLGFVSCLFMVVCLLACCVCLGRTCVCLFLSSDVGCLARWFSWYWSCVFIGFSQLFKVVWCSCLLGFDCVFT